MNPEETPTIDARKIEKANTKMLMQWLRHNKGCKAGTHCEDPFCRYNGDCTCGLQEHLPS